MALLKTKYCSILYVNIQPQKCQKVGLYKKFCLQFDAPMIAWFKQVDIRTSIVFFKKLQFQFKKAICFY